MTEKQVDNVSLVIEDLFRVQDIRTASKSQFIGAITYVLGKGVKYSRGASDYKQGVYRYFGAEDFLSLFEIADLLRSYGFRLGYPQRSYLYNLDEEKSIGFQEYGIRTALSNRGDHAENFIKLRPQYPLYCGIPIFNLELNSNPATRSKLPGTAGVLNCWIGHARVIIQDLRRKRITDKFFRQKRMSFRLATIDYSK